MERIPKTRLATDVASRVPRLLARFRRFEGKTEFLDLVAGLLTLEGPRIRELLKALLRGLTEDPPAPERFQIAELLSNAVYPGYHFSDFGRLFLKDAEFTRFYERFMDPGNWHSYDRKYLLDQMLRVAVRAEGDMAECGVYKGASAWLMCRRAAPVRKRVHLFDSFAGLSRPKDVDGRYWTEGDLTAGEEYVHRNLSDYDNYVTHPGWIPDRFADVENERFCFVHVDVDLYEPTRDSVSFFYPRLSPGGVMLFDDYGYETCPGAKKAIDDYFSDKPDPLLHLPTGQGMVIRSNGAEAHSDAQPVASMDPGRSD